MTDKNSNIEKKKEDKNEETLGWPGDRKAVVESLFKALTCDYPTTKLKGHPAVKGLKELSYLAPDKKKYFVIFIYEHEGYNWRIRIQTSKLLTNRVEKLMTLVVTTVLQQNKDIQKYHYYDQAVVLRDVQDLCFDINLDFDCFPSESRGFPIHVLGRNELPKAVDNYGQILRDENDFH
jgi:hypothetical protein